MNTAGDLKSKANDQITSTTAQVVGSTESTIKAALDAANEVYAKVTDSSKPVIGQVANGAQYIAQSAQDAVSQVKGLYATYEDAYCTPAEYIPPTKVPANLTGAPASTTMHASPVNLPHCIVHGGLSHCMQGNHLLIVSLVVLRCRPGLHTDICAGKLHL